MPPAIALREPKASDAALDAPPAGMAEETVATPSVTRQLARLAAQLADELARVATDRAADTPVVPMLAPAEARPEMGAAVLIVPAMSPKLALRGAAV